MSTKKCFWCWKEFPIEELEQQGDIYACRIKECREQYEDRENDDGT